MTIRTVDLSGRYQIDTVTANGTGGGTIKFIDPGLLNPAWLIGDLDGAGTALYSQNITMLDAPSTDVVDLGGSYTVLSVTPTELTLDSPAAVTADWNLVGNFVGGQTRPLSAFVGRSGGSEWIGPFIVEDPNTQFLVANVVALQGLYKDDGKRQLAFPIQFQIEATPVNQLDVPIGAAQTFNGTVDGNTGNTKDLRAKTLVCNLAVPGRQSVRARRVTPKDFAFKGNVVDEIKWQDLYGMGPVDQPDFGNVTTVRTRTFATQGALNVKERKLNMLVTRRVPIWTFVGTVFDPPAATTNAGHILVDICRDPLIGNRTLDEIDIASIFNGVARAFDATGQDPASVEFSYTFDNDNTSFEEMVHAVADAVLCVPYRQGSQIKLLFEGATDDSTLLFNHRNKVPGSETRTVRFGAPVDNDGVELEYTDPETDTPATIYIPADRSAVKPRKITAVGVRNYQQAYWLAWRAFNKLQYQNTATEFEALGEAAPSIRGERILVADNTRADTQDGEVEAQVGLTLTLSQPVDLSDPSGYTIFLQLPDATVESIPIIAGATNFEVVLARAPRVALALDPMLYSRTAYQIAVNSSPRSSAFLLTEKSPQDSGTYQLQAINYSSLYYLHDALKLWLPFKDASFQDHSPYGRDGLPVGGATTVVDGTRGKRVYSGAAGRAVNFPAFDPPEASYSKSVWVKRTGFADAGLLESVNESFHFFGANLTAGHPAVEVSVAWPDTTSWHHAALTWDEDADLMTLYLDGEPVDEATGVGPRAQDQLLGFAELIGFADDLRLFARAFTSEQIRDLYRATRR